MNSTASSPGPERDPRPYSPTPPIPAESLRLARAEAVRYGVATTASIARAAASDNLQLANRIAHALIASGDWSPFRWRHGDGGGVCFTPGRTVHLHTLRERLAILNFCTGSGENRRLLDRADVAELMQEFSAMAGVPVENSRPHYLHQASTTEPKRLALIRVGRTDDLRAVVEELDQFVCSKAFTPWMLAARTGRFVLTYLLPAPREAVDELGRWLRRRPLVSRVGKAAGVPIPAWVYPARTIPLSEVSVQGSGRARTPGGPDRPTLPSGQQKRQQPRRIAVSPVSEVGALAGLGASLCVQSLESSRTGLHGLHAG